jgi:NADPH:quinone reductase-like Zn-dependent oxidoreductase
MMRALVYRQFTTAEHYEIADVPIPIISLPDGVIIKVIAAAINPGEMKIAAGATKLLTGTPKYVIS